MAASRFGSAPCRLLRPKQPIAAPLRQRSHSIHGLLISSHPRNRQVSGLETLAEGARLSRAKSRHKGAPNALVMSHEAARAALPWMHIPRRVRLAAPPGESVASRYNGARQVIAALQPASAA